MAMKRKAAKMAMSTSAEDSKNEAQQMSDDDELRDPKLLLHKKRQLVSKIREYRDDKRQLETRIGRMDIKQKRYDHHLAVIDRHWSSLDDGLQAILSRADLSAKVDPPEGVPEGSEPSLLNQLLRKDVFNTRGSDSEAEEIDMSLDAKCKFTTDVLQRVAAGLGSKEQLSGTDQALLQQIDTLQASNAVLARERAAMESRMVRCRQSTAELAKQVESVEDLLEAERLAVKKMSHRLQDSETQSKEAANVSAAGASAAASGVGATAGVTQERDETLLDAENQAQERLNESTRLREQLVKLEQESLQLKQQVVDPSDDRIKGSSTYLALAFEYKATYTNHTKLLEKFERLQQENATSAGAAQEQSAKMDAATQVARQELVTKLRAAEDRANTSNDRYEEAREQLERQGLRPDSSAQVTELNLLVSSLRKELDRVKKELKERPRTEETAELKQELAIKIEASEVKSTKLAKEKSRLVDELAEAHKKERQWIEKEKEYKILLDVLQSSSKDSRELTEVRTAERTAAGALAAAEGDLASARAALQALQSESEKGASADGANADDADVEGELNKKVANLEMKLKLQKEEEEGLVTELDEIGGAFEEMQEQNARLLSQLKEKDDENFRLMSTRLKEQSKHAAMEDVGRAHEAKQAALSEKLAAQADVLRRTEAAVKQNQEQLGKTKQELAVTAAVADQCRAQGQTAIDKLMDKQRTFDIVEKQLKSAKSGHDTAVADKQKAQARAARLKEDYDALKRRYDKIRIVHSANGNDELLEEELRLTKLRLKCSVENGAWKEVVIARDGCYHMFSRKCTDTLIKNRNRKCPICNQRFDVSQVVPIHGLSPE